MKYERTAVIALLLSLLVAAGCVKGVREAELGTAGTGKKILIAAYPSEYKNRVAQGLADRYKDRARVTLVPMRKLDSVDYRGYDALVIIDALMAWQMFNIYSRSFIMKVREPEQQKKIVLFLTAADPNPNKRFHDIDCITGASVMNTEADAITRISGRVDAVLKQQ